MKYSKCELVRSVKGTGNSCHAGRGEFVVLNDDTWEVWKRNGEKMRDFKSWYLSLSSAPVRRMEGSYPRYTFVEFN